MRNYIKIIGLLLYCLLFSLTIIAQEQDFLLNTNGAELEGTYTIPPKISKPPIVLIVAGSGATTQDGNTIGGGSPNSYKMIAELLLKNNIACLRYDKRGVGESEIENMNEKDLRIETFSNDVKAIIEQIASTERFGKIFVLGHSEGSLLALLASINNKNVNGYISVAGAGRRINLILKEQLASLNDELRASSYAMLDTLTNGDTLIKPNPLLFVLFRPSLQPYMISWLKYDPAVEIKKLNQPVLIIQGDNDLQVKQMDAELLHAAKSNSILAIIPNMTHPLKTSKAKTVEAQMEVYQKSDLPLNDIFCKTLVDFIKKN